MKNTSQPQLNPEPQPHQSIESSIVQERIRQAQHSFNLALGATALSVFISLVGAMIFLSGKNSLAGISATSGGIVFTVGCTRFAKDANDRLDRLAEDLRDAEAKD